MSDQRLGEAERLVRQAFESAKKNQQDYIERQLQGPEAAFLVEYGGPAAVQGAVSPAELDIIMREVLDALNAVFAMGVADAIDDGHGSQVWDGIRSSAVSELVGALNMFNQTTVRRLADILLEAAEDEGAESGRDRLALASAALPRAFDEMDHRLELAVSGATYGAYNYGVYESAMAGALLLPAAQRPRKVWRTRLDGRERATHHALNGTEAELDRPFLSGGWPLMYPGDPTGEPSEVINCRCTLRFI